MRTYHEALRECGERYRDMQEPATDNDTLWVFTHEFLHGCSDGLPIPKLCRWLGYIQGVLIERGYTSVHAEREWTRPLLRPLDFPEYF